MVDSGSLVQTIVVEMISFVQKLATSHTPSADVDHIKAKKALLEIFHLCRNFLLVLDEKKAIAYKLAIVSEFLEKIREETEDGLVAGFEHLDHEIYRMEQYIQLIKDDPVKQEILLAQVTAGVNHFIDPNSLHPPTVVFWLNEACTLHALKKMQTLLLFVNKQDHAKILQHDRTLLDDKSVKFLLECLLEV